MESVDSISGVDASSGRDQSGTDVFDKGSTKFEPLPDVKNIMITGGAGFMYVPYTSKEVSWN